MEKHLTDETFGFLDELAHNNNREWFQENKGRYEHAKYEVQGLVGELIVRLSEFDPQIPATVKADKCMFRIYRDIRFRKDKTPYKTWLGAGISVNGRKLDGPEYYIHIQPGQSFVAAGYWRPGKDHLAAIRQEIDYNETALDKILLDLQGMPEPLAPNREDMLKRPPVGYSNDHSHIDLLKLKSFTLSRIIPDAQWRTTDAVNRLIGTFREMHPFKLFLEQAIGI